VLGDSFDFHGPLGSRPRDGHLFERNLIVRTILGVENPLYAGSVPRPDPAAHPTARRSAGA
jgi:hypothetical protein